MIVDVYFTPAGLEPSAVQQKTVVVVDVLRTTSTIIEALANGASAVYPTVETEDAIKLAQSLGRDDVLLCGERRGVKIEGYDLGNSPRQFDAGRVDGMRLVMSTTNGTRAFLAAEAADRVLAASLSNLTATVDAVAGVDALAILCAGRQDRFALEDAACAGLLVKAVADAAEGRIEVDDAGRAVLALADSVSVDPSFLRSTAAGRALVDIGMEDDVTACARRDRHGLVPEMRERVIRLPGGPV